MVERSHLNQSNESEQPITRCNNKRQFVFHELLYAADPQCFSDEIQVHLKDPLFPPPAPGSEHADMLVFHEETPAFMFWCCWREPKVRVVVLQREATSGAKWLSVSRFVPHSIVSRLRVNPETRGRLEGARRTFGAET